MAEKTFNFNIIGTVDELKAYQSGTVVNARILDGVTSLHPYVFYNMTSLQSVDFNQIEIIPIDCCRGCTNLTQVLFSTHTTAIGEYAFYDCTKFEDTELPHTLTNIGQYAFYNVGSAYSRGTHTFTMIDNVGVHIMIGDYAFQQSHLSEVDAYINNIGNSAFQSCSSLTDVNIEVHGSMSSYAFSGCTYVENFEIDPNSVITVLGVNAFYNLASNTPAVSRNIAPFDFRNSTFTSLGSYIWGNNYYDGVVYFPSTLATISGSFLNAATGNWKLYFNSVPQLTSSSYIPSDSSNFTGKYFFPYELMDQVTSATNWSSHKSQIIGYGTGFEAGTTLPQYMRMSGAAITWYLDDTLTTQIITSSSVTDTYYCTISANRIVWFVDNPALKDASVTISDGTNIYTAGDPVLVGTSITVTPSYTDPTKDQLFVLKVNGTNYTQAGTATVVMDQNLAISCMYYDGINLPFYSNIADNDWDMIKLASKLNVVPSTWNIGDTKSLIINGQTYSVRLVDKTGKFNRSADGTPAYLSFETTTLLTDKTPFNASTPGVTNNNILESPLMDSLNGGNIYQTVDSALTDVLENIDLPITVRDGDNLPTQLAYHPYKMWLPHARDIFASNPAQYEIPPAEWAAMTTDEYYITHSSSNDRIKQYNNVNENYYGLTPMKNNRTTIMCISTNGSISLTYNSWNQYHIALRFAL